MKLTSEHTTVPSSQSSFVGVLAALTHGIFHDASTSPRVDAAVKGARKRGIFDRLDTWLWQHEVKSREAFLAEATDIVDLEQRQRWLERGRG